MSDSTPPRSSPTTAPLHPWEISPQDVAKLKATGADFLFVDCRTVDENEEASIEGTKLVPMQDLELHLPQLQEHKNDLIVVHCRSGKRSMTVTTVLRAHGFTNVKSMAGGIERWKKEIGS